MLVSQKILHSLNKIPHKKSTKRPIFDHAFRNTNIKSSLVQINRSATVLKTRTCYIPKLFENYQ